MKDDKALHLGLGVMIHTLCGEEGERAQTIQQSLGKTITALELKDDILLFTFEDKTQLELWDDGQSCCEARYMRTDDKLADHIGSTLLDMELRHAPNMEDEYGEHEVQFLAIKTSNGQFVMSNHNEHNGYYGGFYINAKVSSIEE